jgi:transcriptional regulator with XRE-family HTH domain
LGRAVARIKAVEEFNSPVYKIVGENIKKIRKSKRLTQGDLTNLTGYCKLSIIKFETSKQRITLEGLDMVATALGIPISVLFTENSSSEVMYWKSRCLEVESKAQKLKLKVNELVELIKE